MVRNELLERLESSGLQPAVSGAWSRARQDADLVRLRSRDLLARYSSVATQLPHPSTRTIAATAASSALAAGLIAYLRYAFRPLPPRLADDAYLLVRLYDLRGDDEALAALQAALLSEWGPFGPRDLEAMRAMAERAGKLAFVLGVEEEGEFKPAAILQTGRAQVGGDPARLVARYPVFGAITDEGSWESAAKTKGDTALLLQITTLGTRGRGTGSLLRDAALNALPKHVKFALTTTPVEEPVALDGDPMDFPPAAKFHYRGGARPAGYREAYKVAPVEEDAPEGRQRHPNVVFMRYRRLEDASWEGVRKTELRLTKWQPGSPVRSLLRRLPHRHAEAPEPAPAAPLEALPA